MLAIAGGLCRINAPSRGVENSADVAQSALCEPALAAPAVRGCGDN